MNIRGIHAIYRYEMNRSFRTLIQSLVSPVLSTILYFIVFGAAIGSRMDNISNVSVSYTHLTLPTSYAV